MGPNCLLIPIILLASLSLLPANASANSELQNGFSKQRRVFHTLNSNLELEPQAQDEYALEETNRRSNPGLRLWEELLKTRQRALAANAEYDQIPEGSRYDSERDEMYELENLFDASSGRSTRSKNRHKSTFQSLCPSKRETVFLNLDPEYEYRPDYYEEVRCANGMVHNENKIQAAVCTEAGFSCIQLNATIFLTRRARSESCWETETRVVPSACDCMWPKHQLGDIMAHH